MSAAQAYLVGNDKGGVGKDVAVEGICHAALQRGLTPTLIEIETSERLRILYPDAISIPLEVPSPEAVYANPDVTFAALDRAGDLWRSAPLSITSLGANVTSATIAWCRANGAAMLSGVDVTAVIVLTMNRHALAAGLKNLYDIGVVLPNARRVAVLNDLHSNFLDEDRFLARRLEEARGSGKAIETIRLPRCSAPAWGYAQNVGRLDEIANLDPNKLIALGLPEGPVRRSMSIITTWISDALIAPLGALLPEPQPASRGQGKTK